MMEKLYLIFYIFVFLISYLTPSLENGDLLFKRENCIAINSSFDYPIACNAEIIGRSYEQLTEKFDTPDLINCFSPEYYNGQGEQAPIVSICYKNEKRKLIGKEPTEYCYIGFDAETGLANVVICPWYLPDEVPLE